jgi:hypothetical protein
MQGDRESVWFPGFGVYRQSLNGGWEDALARLERDLGGLPAASQEADADRGGAVAP